MIVFKFLSRGAVGPFSGFRWPAPAKGAPGAWVEATGALPSHGVHACRVADLPYWLDEELWVVELDGEVQATAYQLAAARGRLLARVERWPEVAVAFGADCAATLRARAEVALAQGGLAPEVAEALRGYVADAEGCARGGNAAAAAYVAARASAVLAADPSAVVAERRRQAAWLEVRLGTAGGDDATAS